MSLELSHQFTPEEIQEKLSSPPFVVVDGIINIRDIGGYTSQYEPSRIVKRLSVFRAGEPSRITETGIAKLKALGIRKIFDVRSNVEINTNKAKILDIEGVDVVRAPISVSGWDSKSIEDKLNKFKNEEIQTFLDDHTEMLQYGAMSFGIIFIHFRDNPEVPCLVHCTAGKDRTGVFAALFLSLLGVSDEDISNDYSLTVVGLAPAIPMLTERMKMLVPSWNEHREGLLNMGSSKPEVMKATLDLIRERYGGAEEYLKVYGILTADDIKTIRRNFLVAPCN